MKEVDQFIAPLNSSEVLSKVRKIQTPKSKTKIKTRN